MCAWQVERRGAQLELVGELGIADAPDIWAELKHAASSAADVLDVSLRGVAFVDGAIVALVAELTASLRARGTRSEIVDIPDRFAALVQLYRARPNATISEAAMREHGLARLGAATEHVGLRIRGAIAFAGELLGAGASALRGAGGGNRRSLPGLLERVGADGVPIVLVLNFLVGLVMAFQSTRQLARYGADIFVADIVSISMTRELAPLITAIIIAGRSGAAFAAELGTMRVSEEIDALRTLGFAPVPYLVVPRIVALALVAPALTLLGDIVGVAGGCLVAAASLGVSPRGYLSEVQKTLVLSDIWTGLVKSVVFGATIAVIGCRQGLATHGDASSVGRATTTTVVASLFAIVLIDTLFTLLFRGVGA